MKSRKNRNRLIIFTLTAIICGVVYFAKTIFFSTFSYSHEVAQDIALKDAPQSTKPADVTTVTDSAILPASSNLVPVTHIPTPDHVKAAYISSWVAGYSKYRDPIIKLIDNTELNTIVIDVKDSTGRIGFQVADPELAKMGSVETRIKDIRALTNMLHQKNIYIIGRVAVFQDPYMTAKKPEWSITRKSDGAVWKDNKGLSFLDPANQNVWKYTVAIARDAYNEGFDEINFDYVRYPSDGDIKNINYHIAKGVTRADNIESFFKYLSTEVKKDTSVKISADLFGLTTEATDDMGIGQVWEKAMPYFDFIAPMVYPSHYPPGQDGFKNPASHPYDIIHKALLGAVAKTNAMTGQDIKKIRPWLQDFNLGAVYTADMVKAEMKAVYDNNLNSWMLWDPNNRYTPGALALESSQ